MLDGGILDRDYSEIEKDLVDPKIWDKGNLSFNPIAPPQGNPFLEKVKPLKKLLNKCALLYRR